MWFSLTLFENLLLVTEIIKDDRSHESEDTKRQMLILITYSARVMGGIVVGKISRGLLKDGWRKYSSFRQQNEQTN